MAVRVGLPEVPELGERGAASSGASAVDVVPLRV